MCYLISFLQLLSEVGSIPILQMTKLRIKEVKLLAQGHRATKSHLRIQTPDVDTPKPMFLHKVDPMGVVNQYIFVGCCIEELQLIFSYIFVFKTNPFYTEVF